MHIMEIILFLAACGLSFCIGRCFSKLKAATILDELITPGKTNIEISNILWEEIINLMYIASGNSYKSSEESIQRQLGLVIYLFNKEFNLWN